MQIAILNAANQSRLANPARNTRFALTRIHRHPAEETAPENRLSPAQSLVSNYRADVNKLQRQCKYWMKECKEDVEKWEIEGAPRTAIITPR
jgi:hypothetical protein